MYVPESGLFFLPTFFKISLFSLVLRNKKNYIIYILSSSSSFFFFFFFFFFFSKSLNFFVFCVNISSSSSVFFCEEKNHPVVWYRKQQQQHQEEERWRNGLVVRRGRRVLHLWPLRRTKKRRKERLTTMPSRKEKRNAEARWRLWTINSTRTWRNKRGKTRSKAGPKDAKTTWNTWGN